MCLLALFCIAANTEFTIVIACFPDLSKWILFSLTASFYFIAIIVVDKLIKQPKDSTKTYMSSRVICPNDLILRQVAKLNPSVFTERIPVGKEFEYP